ncbi:MAG: non-canonical purine NTP pyrophosphatase [Thermomicrobiales bacterium]
MTAAPKLRLIVASHNPDKAAVVRAVVGAAAEVMPAPRGISLETGESHDSLGANAEEKARYVSRQVPGTLVVATDGGLEIPALGTDWNPVLTRRFAGPDATNADRMRALLARTRQLAGADRAIAWREAMAIARDGETIACWEETGPAGLLAESAPAHVDGQDGFWLPLLWQCPEFDGRLLSDLSERERGTRYDHWQRLGERLRTFLAGVGS